MRPIPSDTSERSSVSCFGRLMVVAGLIAGATALSGCGTDERPAHDHAAKEADRSHQQNIR